MVGAADEVRIQPVNVCEVNDVAIAKCRVIVSAVSNSYYSKFVVQKTFQVTLSHAQPACQLRFSLVRRCWPNLEVYVQDAQTLISRSEEVVPLRFAQCRNRSAS